jgi:L-ribulose-5-phosphate 3-epimerase
MSNASSRRSFLKSAAAAPLAAAFAPSIASSLSAAPLDSQAQSSGSPAYSGGTPKKSMLISLVQPKELPLADKFKVARDAGFTGMEMHTVEDQAEAEMAKKASEETGVKSHSVMNAAQWRSPLSSGDPEVVNKSVAGMETSLKNAVLWGAGTVLLVPAVVDAKTPYQEAWTRSQKVIKERLLPKYQEQKVIIAVEEVWNKFLQSPLEFARYVDEFESPWVKAYFDVGNVVINGFPQDWIRTLGSRIVRLHLKDFRAARKDQPYQFTNLGEGDIDWPEVRRALAEIGYSGYMTTEISGGDLAYLKDVSARVDRFIAGEAPIVKPATATEK